MFERKFIAIAQKRLGASFLGRNGWAHVPADLLKFWLKQTNKNHSLWLTAQNSAIGVLFIYYTWSIAGVVFFLSDGMQSPVDFWDYQWLVYFAYANLSTLFLFHVAMGQRSKYSMLAAGRLLIVSILLEVFFSICFMWLYFHTGGYAFDETADSNSQQWLALALPPLASMFFLYILFEAKRAPFDHTEAESELVAGHQIEFGGRALLFLLLAEYVHIFFCLFLLLFLCLGAGDMPSFNLINVYYLDFKYNVIVL